jgi:hypothetical protein
MADDCFAAVPRIKRAPGDSGHAQHRIGNRLTQLEAWLFGRSDSDCGFGGLDRFRRVGDRGSKPELIVHVTLDPPALDFAVRG